MKIGPRNKKRLYTILGISIIVVALAVYVWRGWVRGSLIPGFYSSYHQPRIERLLDNEFSKIKPAFDALGINNYYKANKPDCLSGYYEKFEIYMPCHSSNQEGRGSLPQEDFKQRLQEASPTFSQNGWHYTDGFELNQVNNADKWIKGNLCYFDFDTPINNNEVNVHIDMRCEYGKNQYE